jgi:hypothetical protein
MSLTGITDAMVQYERTAESIYKNNPKHGKPHGIKRPDTRNIFAVLTGLFVIFTIIAQLN